MVLDNYMMVFIPGYFTHLLDIAPVHEPYCHILLTSPLVHNQRFDMNLVPIFNDNDLVMNLKTLEIFSLAVTKSHLVDTFKSESHLDNRLAIIHYLLVHMKESDVLLDVSILIS